MVGLCLVLAGTLAGVVVSSATSGRNATTAERDSSVTPTPSSTPTSSTADEQLSDEELAARHGKAVYRVDARRCGDMAGGTAFAVDEHHLVTNRHVVALDAFPTVVSRDGERIRARVVAATRDPDVAVLAVERALPHVLTFASAQSLSEGEHLVALGYPVPIQTFTVTPGTLTSFADRRNIAFTDAKVDHGHSGGPALTSDGDVAGIVTYLGTLVPGAEQLVGVLFTEKSVGQFVSAGVGGSAGTPDVLDCDQLYEYLAELYDEYFDAPPATRPPTTAVSALDEAVAKVTALGYSADASGYDGGATLRVIIGRRLGSEVEQDQKAFFFVGNRYIGTDASDSSANVTFVSQPDDMTITLAYALYEPTDAPCCPSTGEAAVRFHWNGSSLIPLDEIPPSDVDASNSRR